ncbi:MAG TPA: phosphatase PAP2-related protein [Candidatus Dojkabacteria bacterium]|nr:phosphatase PAP2-related protein [Candidatus Dojkabacteria bacterium]
MEKLNKEEIIRNVFNREILISSILLFLASEINPYVGKYIIPLYAANRPSAPDLFFLLMPYVKIATSLNIYLCALILLVFIVSIFKENGKNLSKYLFALTIAYWMRAIVILFTPLGVPSGIDLTGVNTQSELWDSGFFFSGHTIFLVTTYLYINGKHKILKNIGLILCVLGVIVILLARNHYSIDIYGGIVTSLLIYEYMKRKK